MPNGSSRKKINLALQGSGAYGAFTWGVNGFFTYLADRTGMPLHQYQLWRRT
jgi:hypothetical protein